MKYLLYILLFIPISSYAQYQGESSSASLIKPNQLRRTISPMPGYIYVIATDSTSLIPYWRLLNINIGGSGDTLIQMLANTNTSTSHLVTLSDGGGSFQLSEGTNINLVTTGTASDGIVTINATDQYTGTVTSIGITPPAAGITVSGSPVTTSGNITLALANDLAALEGVSGGGFAVRTTTDTWALRAIATANSANITVSNGSGSAGNPALNLATTAVAAGSYGSGSLMTTFTVDAYGRLTAAGTSQIPSQTLSRPLAGTLKLSNYTGASTFVSIPDSSSSNELQTIANTSNATSHTATLSQSGGSLQIIEGSNIALSTGGTGLNGTLTITASDQFVGTVTSVAATAPAAGFTVSGSPITSSGTLTFALANDLSALEGLSSTGIAVRSATDTWMQRTIISGTAANITISNGNGVSGNPSVDLTSTAVTPGTYGASGTHVGQFTVDAYGRITAASNTSISLTGIGGVSTLRQLNTAGLLSGGGDLSSDRTFTTSVATNKLIGRATAGTGVFEAITLGTGLSFTGTTLNVTETGTGFLKHVKAGSTYASQYGIDVIMSAAKDTATVSLNYPTMTTRDSFQNVKADLVAVDLNFDDLDHNSKITVFNFKKARTRTITTSKNWDADDSQGIVVINGTSVVYTLQASPTDGEEVSIINLASSLFPQLSGNGVNINSSTTYNFTAQYEKIKIRYFSSLSKWLIIP